MKKEPDSLAASLEPVAWMNRRTRVVTVCEPGMLANDCDNDECPHFERAKTKAVTVEAVWDEDGYSWVYETAIPHATFDIVDEGEKFCRGIVFRFADIAAIARAQGGE
jgi:hypothetical protein